MTKGIFVHRTDSIYDDSPAEQYQFPRQYLTRVSACIGDWIIYYEPSKIRDTRGYFALAKVAHVVPDPTARDMYLALIEPGTYLDFPNPVPFNGPLGLVERGVLNEQGKISGRAQSAVRPLSIEDFNRIIDLGLADDDSFLPRIDEASNNMLREERSPFQFEIQRDRVANLGSRLVREGAPSSCRAVVHAGGRVSQGTCRDGRAARDLSLVPVTPPERRHQLTEDRDEQYAVDLVHPKRLIFEVNHDPIPRNEDGGIDLTQVTAITIVEVVDYH